MSEEINKNANLVHLHNHTYYSLLDGYSSPEDMAKTAAVMGFKSLAITDHGSCAGMLAFQKACIENNIKPILGQEFYSTEDHKYQEKDSNTYHLVLLAKNAEGTRNLMKLSTLGELEGKYKKPRIDFSLLEKYHSGLVCTSACFLPGTMVFTPNGFEKIEKIEKNIVVSHFGKDRKAVPFSRIYSGELKAVVCEGLVSNIEATDDHKFFIVRYENQSKIKSKIIISEDTYLNAGSQFVNSRRRNFDAEWTSKINEKDWLLFPVENRSNSYMEWIDTLKYTTLKDSYSRITISKRGLGVLKYLRKRSGKTVKQLEINNSWSKQSIYSTENGLRNVFSEKLKKYCCILKIDFNLFISKYCTPTNPSYLIKKQFPEKIKISKDLLFVLGAYCAEGSSRSSSIEFSLNVKEVSFAKEIIKALYNVFNIQAKWIEKPENHQGKVVACSRLLATFLSDLCGIGSDKKMVPSFIFNLPFDLQKHFIKGYLLGDGCWIGKKKRANGLISAASISEKMTLGLARLLLNGSYYPNLHIQQAYAGKNGTRHRTAYRISICGKQHLSLKEFVWFNGDGILSDDNKVRNNIPICVNGINYWTSKVISVKKRSVNDIEVRCLQVEQDHSFIVGFSSVHNCCAGEIPIKIYDGKEVEAEEITKKYKSLFGDDFYIEIMMHKYFPEKNDQSEREKMLARKLYDLAKRNGIKAIATNDCHYATKSDSKYQDILLSMQTLANMKDPDRFTFGSDDFYLKPYDEMMKYFGNAPELLSNTLEIAEKIEKDSLLQVSKDLLPNFDVPKGYADEVAYLRALVVDGMKAKGLINKPEYRERIKFEMKAIVECGYVRYFLVLWDIINYTRQQKIRLGTARGSAAGSLVLFVIGITGIDPIKYDLLFERFINPERVSPPDVDIDFDYYRRDEVRDYIINKYGQDYCSKIGTYNTLKPRSSIRYGAKALDIGNDWEAYQKALSNADGKSVKLGDFKRSLELADFIAKQIPFGPNETIETALQQSEDFKNCMSKYPLLLDACRHVEGNLVSSGVHAAGIVVCKNKVADHVPMRLNKGQVCTQLDKNEVEELGLLKFDLLSLKTLTVIERTLQMIKDRYDKVIDIDNINDYDPKLFKLLNGGYPNMDNRGIFQFENFGMSKLLKAIRVDSFKDMAVATALFRPGPLGAGVHDLFCDMKHGRKKDVSLHPKMNEILKNTYGLMCYQEDFMKVSQVLAGFTKGQSDTLRKYVGKKKPEALKEMRVKFVEGCLKTNTDVSEDIANKIFDQIEYFGGYGFNKCLSGDTKVKNKLDNKIYNLEELETGKFGLENNKRIVLDSFVNGDIVEDDLVEVFETGRKE